MSKVEIKSNGSRAEVYLDGVKLESVRSFELSWGFSGVPTLTLDLNCFDLTVDGEWYSRHKYLDREIRLVSKREDGTESIF